MRRRLPPPWAYSAEGLGRGVSVSAGRQSAPSMFSSPSERASLSLNDVDVALTGLSEMAGEGVEQRRKELLSTLLARSTEAEQWCLRRLLLGELRQGALEGLVAAAVADASRSQRRKPEARIGAHW